MTTAQGLTDLSAMCQDAIFVAHSMHILLILIWNKIQTTRDTGKRTKTATKRTIIKSSPWRHLAQRWSLPPVESSLLSREVINMIDLNTVGRNQLQIHCARKTRPRIPMITQIDVGIVYKQSHYGWIQNIAFNYTVPGELKRAHCCNRRRCHGFAASRYFQ